jgi:hypothetical protein
VLGKEILKVGKIKRYLVCILRSQQIPKNNAFQGIRNQDGKEAENF